MKQKIPEVSSLLLLVQERRWEEKGERRQEEGGGKRGERRGEGGREEGGGRDGGGRDVPSTKSMFHPPRQLHCRENGGCVASQDSKFKLFIIVSVNSDQLRTGL